MHLCEVFDLLWMVRHGRLLNRARGLTDFLDGGRSSHSHWDEGCNGWAAGICGATKDTGILRRWLRMTTEKGWAQDNRKRLLLHRYAFAGAAVGLQDALAQAEGFGRDFDQLVVGDELDGLLEREVAIGHQADRFVGT